MIIGKILEISFKSLAIFSLSVTLYSCLEDRQYSIENVKKTITTNSNYFDSILVNFSKENHKSMIKAIYFDKKLPTIQISKELQIEFCIEKNHVFFDEKSKDKITMKLINLFPTINQVISNSKRLNIDLLKTSENKILLKFLNVDFIVQNFDYIEKPGLRSKEEMLSLYFNKKSKYWIYQINSKWLAISDP